MIINPQALQKRHGIAFSWEDIIRWTNESHSRLIQTIASFSESKETSLKNSIYGTIFLLYLQFYQL